MIIILFFLVIGLNEKTIHVKENFNDPTLHFWNQEPEELVFRRQARKKYMTLLL